VALALLRPLGASAQYTVSTPAGRPNCSALPASGTQLNFEAAELATGVYTLRQQAGPAILAKRFFID
jgi:hypothetical protein